MAFGDYFAPLEKELAFLPLYQECSAKLNFNPMTADFQSFLDLREAMLPGLDAVLKPLGQDWHRLPAQTPDKLYSEFLNDVMFLRNGAYSRFVPIAPHASESIEVIMCTHGTNRYYMADAIIDLRPGDVLIIAPGAQQATGIFTAECVNRMMRIRRLALKERMSAILDGKGVVSELLQHSTKGFSDSWCVVHMGEDLNRSSLMELLENTPARPEPDTILFENSLMVAFFSQLQLQYADRAELHLSDSSSQEKALIDCLRREFGHITKQELAARYSYSERQVLRIVQKTGVKDRTEIATIL